MAVSFEVSCYLLPTRRSKVLLFKISDTLMDVLVVFWSQSHYTLLKRWLCRDATEASDQGFKWLDIRMTLTWQCPIL